MNTWNRWCRQHCDGIFLFVLSNYDFAFWSLAEGLFLIKKLLMSCTSPQGCWISPPKLYYSFCSIESAMCSSLVCYKITSSYQIWQKKLSFHFQVVSMVIIDSLLCIWIFKISTSSSKQWAFITRPIMYHESCIECISPSMLSLMIYVDSEWLWAHMLYFSS